jgi:hAT family C-terminal dimerisation region
LVAAEILDYRTISIYNGDHRHDILTFWKYHEPRLPILSMIAKRILVIQASSSESERHFSTGGFIVNERRGRLSDQSVESLVVLREAYLNEMWPKCNLSNSPEDNQSEQPQLHESVSMASIADPENSISI